MSADARRDSHHPTGSGVSRAVILAAGRGARLGAHTDACPKPLLSLHSSGQPTLIGRQLEQLESRGVRHVTVAVGYLGAVLAKELAARPGGLTIATVENRDWASSGSGCSLVQAADAFRAGEDVLLTHGDIIYDDAILDAVLATASRAGSAIAADRSWRAETHDEVLAWTRDGRLAGVRKGAADREADPSDRVSARDAAPGMVSQLAGSPGAGGRGTGEFIGVSVFSAGFAAAFVGFVEQRTRHDRSLDYEQPLLSEFIARSEHSAAVAFSDGLDWRNVNYPEDLAWARERCVAAQERGA